MKYIKEMKANDKLDDVYLLKEMKVAQTKSGGDYYIITLADKTGTLDCRIWDTDGIALFDKLEYVHVKGNVSDYNGTLQAKIYSIEKTSAYDVSDYMPVSKYSISSMIKKLFEYIDSVENGYLKALLTDIFTDKGYLEDFEKKSAASSVHHAFVGGLLQHTLEVTKTCAFLANNYQILNKDLIVTAAILHDIGKTRELTALPENAYSDEGNLIGHIVIGVEIIDDSVRNIEGFPEELAVQLKHCILAHHGELEWGSPKKPALIEAQMLHFADNISAKMEAYTELFETEPEDGDWYGFQKALGGRIRKTVI